MKVNRIYRYLEEEMIYFSVKLRGRIVLGINGSFGNV